MPVSKLHPPSANIYRLICKSTLKREASSLIHSSQVIFRLGSKKQHYVSTGECTTFKEHLICHHAIIHPFSFHSAISISLGKRCVLGGMYEP